MSDLIQDENKPSEKPPGTVPAKTVLKVIGFSCLAVLLVPLVIFGGLIVQSQNLGNSTNDSENLSPTMTSQMALAEEYKQEFQDNMDLIPSFGDTSIAVFNFGLPCPETNTSPDTCLFTETKETKTEQNKKICEEVIALGAVLGATQDSAPTFSALAIMTEFSSESVDRCIETMESYPRSVGWAFFSPAYYLQGEASNGAPFAIELTRSQNSPISALTEKTEVNTDPTKLAAEKYQYSIITSTNYETPDPIQLLPSYFDPKIQLAALLDTVAYYRRSNPDLPIFDPTFTETMIAQYKKSFRLEGTVEPFVTNGEAHWIHFKDKDGFEYCVSVGESRAELEVPTEVAMGNMLESGLPGNETQLIELAGLRNEVNSIKGGHPFGTYKRGACN